MTKEVGFQVYRQSERGSVLFFILIGVALFAALSYAVTSSLRDSGGGAKTAANEEKMSLALTELRTTVVETRTAIQMIVSNGYAVDEIDAYTDSEPDQYRYNNSLCTSDKCKLYKPEGGGIKFFPFSYLYPQFSSSPDSYTGTPQGVFWTWWAYKGTLQGDLLYRAEVTKDFCNYINKSIGIKADIDSFPVANIGSKFQLDGHFAPLATGHEYSFTSGHAGYLAGKSDGCARMQNAPFYVYVAFLYAR